MNSIFTDERYQQRCVHCGKGNNLHRHHIYPGSFRNASEKYGLTIYLCFNCHDQIHRDPQMMKTYQNYYQRLAMNYYHWSIEDWIQNIGKNFLLEEKDA